MPRIDAPSVAEHRRRQERALLDAARALLAETGDPPSLAAVGARAGLARSSVYQYYSSREDLLVAVVGDVFPDWARQVRLAVEAAGGAGERVWAYVRANVELFSGAEQAVATALARAVDPQVLRGPMEAFHAELQQPLRTALTELGEPAPDATAEAIDALVLQVSRDLRMPGRAGGRLEAAEGLALLRRLLAGYLGLPQVEADDRA